MPYKDPEVRRAYHREYNKRYWPKYYQKLKRDTDHLERCRINANERRERLKNDPSFIEERRASEARRYQKHRSKRLRVARDVALKRKYGISLSEYESMAESQNGRCAICDSLPDKKGLAVDHCHDSGRVRGLLCNKCNAALGFFRDDPERVGAAMAYLRRNAN